MGFRLKEVIMLADFEEDLNGQLDFKDGSADIIVIAEELKIEGVWERRRYLASFFTFIKVERGREVHKREGAFLHGKYFWVEGMVLVEDLLYDNIISVVEHMLEEGDFQLVFKRI